MKSRLFPFTIVLLVSAFLAGCGGGGGGAPATPPVNIGAIVTQPVASSGSTPSATAAPGTSSTNAPLSSKIAFNAHFVIMASADQVAQNAARKAAGANRNLLFVSPGTNGISLVISQGGTQISTQAADVSSTSPLCSTSGGSRTCNIPLNLPSGTYSFAATLYNETPSGGVIPGGAQELGTAVASSSILIGQTNSVDFFIGAVVASLGIGTASNTAAFGSLPASGVASSYTILLIPTDASGNAISGSTSTFANQPTVTLGENGGSGHMHLVYNGNASGTSATVVHASDSLQVAYDGAGSPGYYVTVSLAASGATTSTLQLSPLFVAGDSKYSGGTLTYTATAQSEAFAITEASAPGTVTYGTTSGAACPSLPTGSNPQLPVPVTGNVVGSGASATMTVTANVAPQAPTGCDVKIADNLGTSITIPIVLPSGTSAASSAVVNAQIDPTHYSTGTPAALNVTQGGTSVTSVTVRQSPPTTLTVAESNDVTAPVVTPAGCSAVLTVASSLTQGTWTSSAMGALSGTITLVSLTSGTCSLQIADGNGQSQSISIVATVPGQITEFSALSGSLYAITAGSDGNIWITESNQKVAKVNPATGAATEYSVAFTGIPQLMTAGSDGNLWVGEQSLGKIAKVSTSGTLLGEYATAWGQEVTGMALASDGNVWFLDYDNAGQISYIEKIAPNGTITTINGLSDLAYGMTVGPDHNLWVGEQGNNTGYDVGKITTGGSITGSPNGGIVGQTVESIATGGDGNLWELTQSSNLITSVSTAFVYQSGLQHLLSPDTAICADSVGNIWVSGTYSGKGGFQKITTANRNVALYQAVGGGFMTHQPTQMVLGPDGNIWYIEAQGKYGYVSP